jgi:Ion channel
MVPRHLSFKAEIKKLKFKTEMGTTFPATALIRFHVPGKEKSLVELMGNVEEREIYKAIDRGEAIHLDHCYIEKFSLRDYRLTRNMDSREKVVIKGFTAREALFGGYASLDFSNAVIEGEEFSLGGAWISGGDVNFESVDFRTRQISFHDTHFSEGYFNFKNVQVTADEVSFKNCVFGKGIKDFQYTSFGADLLSFANAEFDDGDVNFINTHFGGSKVSFKIARFGTGKVDFHFAAFKDVELSFERAEFGPGRVDFRTVEFGNRRVNFNRSVFGSGEVVFDGSEMDSGKFSFKRAVLGSGDFSFEEVMFEKVDVSFERTLFCDERVSFYKSRFSSLSLAFCHLNGFLDLRVSRCGNIDLSSTVVRDMIDMNPHDFHAQIATLHLGGMRLLGRFYLDWYSNHVSKMIYDQANSSHHLRAEQFRILKENFKNLGLYNAEDKAYVEFKRCESKALLNESVREQPVAAIYQYPLYWFKRSLFDRAGLYATSPGRVLITMLTSFVLFSLLYYFMLLWSPADIISSVDDQLSMMARSFYHSAITFLTIGYGDHYPYGAVRWVSALEGFSGLFLMSYFTVAFVRKVLR